MRLRGGESMSSIEHGYSGLLNREKAERVNKTRDKDMTVRNNRSFYSSHSVYDLSKKDPRRMEGGYFDFDCVKFRSVNNQSSLDTDTEPHLSARLS